MDISEQSHVAIASALKEALKRYTGTGEESVLTDIHLHPNQETGEVVISDDDDAILARTVVNEWVNYEGDDFYTVVEPLLRKEVVTLKEQGLLDKIALMKPYSFVLIDDEKESVADLLLVDDDETLFLNDELLKGLDEELDAFLKDLLEK
ncbi:MULTISPECIES: hypothetical protein [Bacteroidaceae]|uniref:hypothetical protein n=1 Tax=Bacteroidaceae TaxID=815 RepID=UPI000B382B16|nr:MULTISPECIES: hypothetical protein [Bacteroidaceae]MDM8306346.1 hypothetical protein [Phocaeicola salanitronis]OUO21465.1 hypothetical protein B5F91_05880 [Bacteroides sp. An322]HJC98072.1 hypothetical protein [Candidatus Phocaeicola merdavium]